VVAALARVVLVAAVGVHPEPVTAVGAARLQPSPKNITVTTRDTATTRDITAESTTEVAAVRDHQPPHHACAPSTSAG
jgi:hypothetical protein